MRIRALHAAGPVRALLGVLALGAVLAACGNPVQSPAPTSVPTSQATAAPGTSDTGSPPLTTAPQAATVRAYFGLGSTAGNPILAPVERPAPTDQGLTARATAALQALLAGPLEPELSGSPAMFTAISSDAALDGVQVDGNGVATANFTEGFFGEDDLPALRTALAQVVLTLTQFSDITGVQVTIEGAVMEQTDTTGQQLGRPATRADYQDQLGAIFVDDPAWGATLRSPLHLSGLADVFEAQFRFRLLDADGRSLADGAITASCGSGCLGTYQVEVPFNVTTSTQGRLQVFDPSEVDGSPENLVDYPVTLLP